MNGGRGPVKVEAIVGAVLDEAGVRDLFRDLAALAQVDEIRLKHATDRRAQARAETLDAALPQLLNGAVRAVQIRYAYDGERWCDTLLPAPGGHRVVRMQEPRRPVDA